MEKTQAPQFESVLITGGSGFFGQAFVRQALRMKFARVCVLSRGEFHWVFALADAGLSTPAVYSECDVLRAGRSVPEPYVSDMLMQAVRAGDPVLLGKALHNDLQAAALSLRPSLAQVLEVGDDFGALGGIVSGSGPTCAFVARDDEHSLDLAVALTASGVCRTVRRATGPVAGAKVVG